MRAFVFAASIALLLAGTALADEPAAASADWTRDGMSRALRANDGTEATPVVQWGFGYVDFRALGTRWHMAYLPVSRPFSGADIGTTREWPDPFALTGTSFPMTSRTYRDSRSFDPEFIRISNTDRARVSLNVRGGR